MDSPSSSSSMDNDMLLAFALQLQELEVQEFPMQEIQLQEFLFPGEPSSRLTQGEPAASSAAGAGGAGSPIHGYALSPDMFGLEDEMPMEDGEELRDDVGVECEICQEANPLGSMLELSCGHLFCLPCLARYGETALQAGRVPIPCPSPGCSLPIGPLHCEMFLDPASLSRANRLLAELSISDDERFFCPFKDCSMLMVVDPGSRPDSGGGAGGWDLDQNTCATCHGCKREVCIACRVPWHEGATCAEFQAAPEGEREPNDFKLKQLAQHSEWKRCYQCGSWVERMGGCPHMTCRCKAEFCYGCAKPWVNKKPTCRCFSA